MRETHGHSDFPEQLETISGTGFVGKLSHDECMLFI